MATRAALLFSLLSSLFITFSLAAQPSAPAPIPAPLRNLTWGQLNFIHSTDVHGWYAGHLQEPSFSADWGDYISFVSRMRERAEREGIDLLVIDTGDRVEGTGLYDSSIPKGLYTRDILKQQHIDLLCSGNHELYKPRSAEDELLITVPDFKDKYLSSNIDIIDPHTGKLVPLAPRFKKFTTERQGIRIMAFGFLFDFTSNSNNTVVHSVEDTIKEPWFLEAIHDREVDLFLVIGHIPAESKEYAAIFKTIRSAQWDTPIQFFAGHFHIRDYVKYDEKAYALGSGRFMETVGWMSISGLRTGGKDPNQAIQASPTYNRRYIDFNLFSLYHHTGLNESTFHTDKGKAVTKQIEDARHALKLDHVYGCSPRNLWKSRAKFSDKDSIFYWLGNEVLPQTLKRGLRKDKSAIAIFNTGGIRFDILTGPFTQDTAYVISPFTNQFKYTKDVPYDKALKIVEILNKQTSIVSHQLQDGLNIRPSFLCPPEQLGVSEDFIAEDGHPLSLSSSEKQTPLHEGGQDETPALIPGYTTKDAGGSDGDDTIHSPISFYRVPNVVHAFIRNTTSDLDGESDPNPELDSNPETLDLIYLDFVEPWISMAAKFVGIDFDVTKDAYLYMDGIEMRGVLVDWIGRNWKCSDE
ncbi:hypothetical protein FQN57_007362 [Myotisia sp. PD_48]|nr:hypothetical protein FQN57_007362 [Myotisia sp. PD_48]